MKPREVKTIRIVGAGFAGLSLARLLARRGVRVEIFEKQSRVGGLLGTHRTSQGLAEKGANGILVSSRLLDLCEDLEIRPFFSLKASSRRYIWRKQARRWPLSIPETFGLMLRMGPRLLAGRGSLKPRAGETLQHWGERNLGSAAAEFLLAPAMQGIYAGDPSRMSASLILGPLFAKKKKRRKNQPKGLLSFAGGMQDLVDALERKCREAGVIFSNETLTSADLSRGEWVIATSAWDAAGLLVTRAPDVSELLQKVEALPLITGTVFLGPKQEKYRGFGCLFPKDAPTRVLGVLMNSYIFDGRDNTYNETWIFGGAKHPQAIALSDADLLGEISNSRDRLFGLESAFYHAQFTRWPRALPHYTLGWESILPSIRDKISSYPGVHLHGNWLGGIGLSHILERSHLLADQISPGGVESP